MSEDQLMHMLSRPNNVTLLCVWEIEVPTSAAMEPGLPSLLF
ncbi:hypothetical protein ABH944_005066 [Caballeronia udeis]|uniref:Uncharacterized protein n=1 Tax=Caballeronia udeis TaxID=1232866 RepID=A0ABW8MN84_9BURK